MGTGAAGPTFQPAVGVRAVPAPAHRRGTLHATSRGGWKVRVRNAPGTGRVWHAGGVAMSWFEDIGLCPCSRTPPGRGCLRRTIAPAGAPPSSRPGPGAPKHQRR